MHIQTKESMPLYIKVKICQTVGYILLYLYLGGTGLLASGPFYLLRCPEFSKAVSSESGDGPAQGLAQA